MWRQLGWMRTHETHQGLRRSLLKGISWPVVSIFIHTFYCNWSEVWSSFNCWHDGYFEGDLKVRGHSEVFSSANIDVKDTISPLISWTCISRNTDKCCWSPVIDALSDLSRARCLSSNDSWDRSSFFLVRLNNMNNMWIVREKFLEDKAGNWP